MFKTNMEIQIKLDMMENNSSSKQDVPNVMLQLERSNLPNSFEGFLLIKPSMQQPILSPLLYASIIYNMLRVRNR